MQEPTHCPKCDVQLIHKEHFDVCPNCGWIDDELPPHIQEGLDEHMGY